MDKVYILRLCRLTEGENEYERVIISQIAGVYSSRELADEDGPALCDKRGYDDWLIETWDLIDGQNGNHNFLLDINTNQVCDLPQ